MNLKQSTLIKTLFILTTLCSMPIQAQLIHFEIQNKHLVTEEDILLPNTLKNYQHQLIQGAIILPKLGRSIWNNGIIPYKFSENFPGARQKNIKLAIDLWTKMTNVQFMELTSKNNTQYTDYIVFKEIPGTLCASYVGRQGGEQEVLLSPRCNTMTVVHELGHVIGLWHEQSRYDRDNYVRILWENIPEDKQYNFNQYIDGGEDYGEYNYQSIMHYSAYAFSKNGEKTIEPLFENIQIGQRDHLSELDIASVNKLYPKNNP